VLLVNLVPDLLAVQRIAHYGENVYILYVAEMDQYSRFLPSMFSRGKSKFSSIPYVTCTFPSQTAHSN
jgi:hypothetical protein